MDLASKGSVGDWSIDKDDGNAGQDAVVLVLFKHIQDLYSNWGHVFEPTKEMVVAFLVACAIWREEVNVPNPM